ncbi:FtsB family cell division protein [Syntrophomonas erecta]
MTSKKKSPVKIVLVGLLCSFMIFTIVPRAKTIYELNERKQALEKQKIELKQQNRKLTQQIEKVDSPAEVERIAREKLGMVKKGEQVLVPTVNP